jgi:hypothetical protein
VSLALPPAPVCRASALRKAARNDAGSLGDRSSRG